MRDKHGATFAKRTGGFYTGNRQAAQIVLEDVEQHGGPTSGLVAWARAFLKAAEENTVPAQPLLPGVEVLR